MPKLTISSPGVYEVTQDITQADPFDHGVYINPGVHYVTLILKARIVGAAGPLSNNSGIYAPYSAALNIIGMGGSVRGFGYGVRGDNNYLARVRDLFVMDGWFRGIALNGSDDAVIQNCDVWNIGGAMWTPDAYCMGIEVSGSVGGGRQKVTSNTVQGIHGVGSGETVGISVTDNGLGAVVMGNIVRNESRPTSTGRSFGLWIGGQSNVIAAGNVFDNWGYGIAVSSPPTGFLDDNHYRKCDTPILDSNSDVQIGDGLEG